MMSPDPTDTRWMDMALMLARRGLGRTWPRPSVGCVLVRDGRLLARGATSLRGAAHPMHAEAEALSRAEDARFATAYVTLEPCAHHGRTPPCAEALIQAGVERVVTSFEDPDPRVAGRGHAALSAAGVTVDVGCRAEQAKVLNRGFLMRVELGRPQVTLKLASTLDGRIATASGESRWITGPAARRSVHLLRARHDAVLVGAGTARADDPMLDVRDLGIDAAPVRVVMDGGLSLPLTGRLARTAKRQPLWLVHRPGLDRARVRAFADLGAEMIEVGGDRDGALDLVAALSALGARGVTRVLCEGGGRLAAGLIRLNLVDELVSYTAGRLIGAEGVPSIASLGLEVLSQAPQLRLVESHPVGPDILSRWVFPTDG